MTWLTWRPRCLPIPRLMILKRKRRRRRKHLWARECHRTASSATGWKRLTEHAAVSSTFTSWDRLLARWLSQSQSKTHPMIRHLAHRVTNPIDILHHLWKRQRRASHQYSHASQSSKTSSRRSCGKTLRCFVSSTWRLQPLTLSLSLSSAWTSLPGCVKSKESGCSRPYLNRRIMRSLSPKLSVNAALIGPVAEARRREVQLSIHMKVIESLSPKSSTTKTWDFLSAKYCLEPKYHNMCLVS